MYVFIVPFLIRNRRQATKEFLNSEVKEFLSPLSSLALVKMGCYFLLKIQFEIKKTHKLENGPIRNELFYIRFFEILMKLCDKKYVLSQIILQKKSE